MTRSRLLRALTGAIVAIVLGSTVILGRVAGQVAPATPDLTFKMVRSAAAVAGGCMPNAKANVAVTKLPRTEQLTIHVAGLSPKSTFTVFVLQVPNAPFGVSVYEGDIATDAHGDGSSTFVGRFSKGSFAVAPGSAVAPQFHTSPFVDAATNPAFAPVHLLHLGIWFKTSARSAAAGCAATLTPFNATHTAGIQVLSTRQYPDTAGPLGQIN